MKIASFTHTGVATWGIVEDEEMLDIGGALGGRAPDLKTALGLQGLPRLIGAAKASAARLPMSSITWLPVVPNPGKILCVGLNYLSHREETGRQATDQPVIFTRLADSQVGHLGAIIRPRVSSALDYEGELAVIIGRHGRYIPRGEASNYIAGYSCYNEGTLRDWQRHTHQWAPGKNFPSTGGFGPWMVTADEIDDISALRLRTRVNGRTMQDATLDLLIFSIAELIEYCSAFTPLAPGDVILTGTPGGVGFKRQPAVYLAPGDRAEVEITGIGTLVNMVADELV